MTRILFHIFTALTLTLWAASAPAQVASTELFKPVVKINGKAVTNYEVQQRLLMLRLFRTPGDLEEQALEGLIDDRLRLIAAERAGLTLTEQEIQAGETEFAGRANLSREEFLQALAAAGVEPSSFRDFVTAGLLWRNLVRERFAPRATVTPDEVDRALAVSSRRGDGVELLFSEIILPANTPAAAAQAERRAAEIVANVNSAASFASYARRYSASPTRANGGRVPRAVPLGNLPGAISDALLTQAPGGVTPPFPIPNAIAIFQLREIIETNEPEIENVAIEYARFLIPGGRTEATLREAAKVRARVDTCDDLYGIAKGLPPELLTREIKAPGEIPRDIALELAKLDAHESSTALTSGNALVFLMLCGRTTAVLAGEAPTAGGVTAPEADEAAEPEEGEDGAAEDGAQEQASPGTAPRAPSAVDGVPEVSRARVRERLINQRVAGYANGYLAELRANAIITYP